MTARSLLLLLIVLTLGWPALGWAQDDDDEPPTPLPPVESPLAHLEEPCANGDPAACMQAGDLWYAGRSPGIDRPNHFRAVNLYMAACAFTEAQGCIKAAGMYFALEAGMQLILPEGTPSADLGAAAEQLQFACEFGHLPSCGRLGDLWVNPESTVQPGVRIRGVKTDYFSASQSYLAGCNERNVPKAADVRPDGKVDARSCARLGELHERGAGVMRNADFAAGYYDRACRAGAADWCAKADSVRAAVADGTWQHPEEKARGDRPDPGARGDGHLGALNPDATRFVDDTLGIDDRKREAGVRLDLVGMMGSRWYYGPPQTLGGIKFKAGLTIWVKLIGFGIETGFNTDRLFLVSERAYARYAHAFVIKGIFPLPIRLPIPALLSISLGAGPLIGHQRTREVPFFLVAGAREHLQLNIGTDQRRGARQWGAIRFEQQQTWLTYEKRLEHSTQVLFLFGFTFGGVAPEYPRGGGRPKESITDRDSPRPTWVD